jgi:protein AATF/BFR2
LGREHYTAVAKSRLRQQADEPGGPQYKGRIVRRNELEDSDSDDPFAEALEDEGSDDDDDDDDDGAADDDGLDGSETNGRDESEEQDMGSEDDDNSTEAGEQDETRANAITVRDLLNDTKSFTSTLSAGAQSDVAKGQAVKTQRKTFDTLLNSRIRLQKALISTNSMVADTYSESTASSRSIEAAETAALALLNNLAHLRATLDEARTGEKRKRTTVESSTSSSDIWKSISTAERSALPHRKAALERWSTKTRATTVTNNKNRLNASATQTLTEVLDAQLSSSHLILRTQTPRSCAPIQSSASSKGALPNPAIYDDADFYGLMLKELLEQRSTDNANGGASEFIVQAPWQVARDAKTRKVVDTKASKGRRLRYTVQEKLQNFMAPEERGEWGDRQRDELFSSLFGQRMALGEGDEVVSEQEDDGADAEEAGLMLFRS